MSARGASSIGINLDANALMAIGAGNVRNMRNSVHNALNQEVATVAPELVSSIPGLTACVFPDDAGEALTVVSDNIADVGVQVLIQGLDADFAHFDEVVVLNGTTPVPLATLATRVNKMRTLGSQACVGIVTTQGAQVYDGMLPEHQRSLVGLYSIPSTAYTQVVAIHASMVKTGGAADASIQGVYKVRQPGGVWIYGFAFELHRQGTSSARYVNEVPSKLVGPYDFCVEAVASAAGIDLLTDIYMVEVDKKP